MSPTTKGWSQAVSAAARYRGLLLPAAAIALVLVLMLPLPAAMMDLLLLGNLALAALVLLTTIFVRSPLEFSVFPTVLLGATLLRVVLNVATTRLILTAGGEGGVEQAHHAAGQVVWFFGEIFTRNSLAVGAILFAILVVVQFVVVTKGATRISEVAARFVLDAMPGKQMAIDADLNAKLITPEQAMQRRAAVSQEADFYGAMDGASKFLRGDAVAAIVITLINIAGGMYVGLAQNGWSLSETAGLFTKLTIGEGLVMQVPAFLTAVAAGLIVTRSTVSSNLGEQVVEQLASRPIVLVSAGALMGLLAMTSLPAIPLLLMGGGFVGLAYLLSQRQPQPEPVAQTPAVLTPAPSAAKEMSDLLAVDPLRVEVGFSLVRMLSRAGDESGESLLDRVSQVRRQIAAELGLVVPPVKIKDNLELDPHQYVIRLRGAKVAGGRLHATQRLAVADSPAAGELAGKAVSDPVLGRPAVWISPERAAEAQQLGYAVFSAQELLTQHLCDVIHRYAAELLTRQQVDSLLESLRTRSPQVVKEVLERYRPQRVQKVLQSLLEEGAPVHDLETVLEAMNDWPGEVQDAALVEHVRVRLGRILSQQYCEKDGTLWCVSLAPEVEDEILSHLDSNGRGDLVGLDAELGGRIRRNLSEALGEYRSHGHRGVVVCSSSVRRAVRQLLEPASPTAVMAYNEIDAVEVKNLSTVGMKS